MRPFGAARNAGPGPAWAWALPALGVLAGSALQLQMARLWPTAWVAALLLGGLLAAVVAVWRRRSWPGLYASSLAAALLAFGITHGRAELRLAEHLPAALQGQDLLLTGHVASLPREGPDGVRFLFEVDAATRQGEPVTVPHLVSLGWYRGDDGDAMLGGAPQSLRAGQRWQLTARLRQPHGAFNPHGFDLELWLFEQGIRANGAVRSRPGAEARKLEEDASHALTRARQDWRDAIRRQVADPSTAGVLAALAVGDQAAIERDDWELFRNTGVAHLMSISGLHVTMFAWGAGLIVGRLWRWRAAWMLWLPAPAAARWGGALAALGYAGLAGWGVPAQRTVWMIVSVALLRQAGLRWPLPAVLLAAALVVTLADPWALLQPGFWLSFVAVGLLVVSEPMQTPRDDSRTWTQRAAALASGGLRAQLVATVGLAPLSLLFFHQLSLVGLLANLAAIPLVTLVVTPLALLGLLWAPLWTAASTLLQFLTLLLQGLASTPLAVWHAAAAPAWAAVFGLLAALLVVLPLPWWLRAWALPLMLPLLAPAVQRPEPGRFEWVAADVGQGTAVLLRTARHLLVYDTGARYSRESDAGERVLLPLLRSRGETQVDLLMLSHRDSDHVGGAASLIRGMPVRALSSSLDSDHALIVGSALPHRPCHAGQSWTWDGVRFEVLHPLAEDLLREPRPKSNALSCVLRVQGADDGGLLLTGDVEAAQEAALVQREGDALRSEVLLVPHHGSRSSSTPGFLRAVSPRLGVVQAAYLSRFGHPAPDVVARYEAMGIALLRSDRCGAYTQPARGAAWCERFRARRYWHHGEELAMGASAALSPSGHCASTPPHSSTQTPVKTPLFARSSSPCPSMLR